MSDPLEPLTDDVLLQKKTESTGPTVTPNPLRVRDLLVALELYDLDAPVYLHMRDKSFLPANMAACLKVSAIENCGFDMAVPDHPVFVVLTAEGKVTLKGDANESS